LSTEPDLEVLLPVHNEAESIEATIREIYGELSPGISVRFIICEDGSSDDTKEILRRLAGEIPIRLYLSDERKGYSRAVREGMEMLEAGFLLCIDSDGQCDPRDFWQFWDARVSCDIVLGWRQARADTFARRAFSRLFRVMYRLTLGVPMMDPSCPYVLIPRNIVHRLAGELGAMQEGFWWEYVARAYRRGYKIRELAVRHRPRAAGKTRTYDWQRMPWILFRHVAALFRIRSETGHSATGRQG